MPFHRYHLTLLLHRIASLLPQWLAPHNLVLEYRSIEQIFWRELGHSAQPVFDGDLPPFLMLDADGFPINLSTPMDPAELMTRMAALAPSSLPASSLAGTNLSALNRLLNLAPFESQWLLWSYCVHRFGRAILPVISLRDDWHAVELMALLSGMPIDAVRGAVASRRLHVWGLLDGIGADGEMPSLLSGWLLASDQFVDWIEQPYASDADLLMALCKAHVSLSGSC